MKKNLISNVLLISSLILLVVERASAQNQTVITTGNCSVITFDFNTGSQGFNTSPYGGAVVWEMYHNTNRGYFTELGNAGSEALTPPQNPFGGARIISMISPPVLNPNLPGIMDVGFDYIVPNPNSDFFQVRIISTYLPATGQAEQVNIEATSGLQPFSLWSTPIPYTDPNPLQSGFRGTVCIRLNDPDITNAANTSYRIEITFFIPEASYSALDNVSLGPNTTTILSTSFLNIEAHEMDDDVEVAWNVTREQSVLHYKVERSANGRDFSEIGIVPANGGGSRYRFIDKDPLSGIAYYRVRNIDQDGKFSYSRSVFIRILKDGNAIVYPVPVTGTVTIEHPSLEGKGQITVYSADGKLAGTYAVPDGSRRTTIDMTTFSTGIYMARFDKGGGETQTLKLIKQ